MFYEVVRVSSKGQIVIPRRMRERFGLKAGDMLVIASDGENILIKTLSTPEFHRLKRLLSDTKELLSPRRPIR